MNYALALTIWYCCLAPVVGYCNRAPTCHPKDEGYYLVPPENVTVVTGGNATFFSQSTCDSMKLYLDHCEAEHGAAHSQITLTTDKSTNITTLTYIKFNVNQSDSGRRIDVYLFCDHSTGIPVGCYFPVYLTVLDLPDQPTNVTVTATCYGLNITFVSNSNVQIILLDKVNNSVVYNKTVQPPYHFIEFNKSGMKSYSKYQLNLTGHNKVGQSKPVTKPITPDNMISFGIKGTNVSYNQNMPQATITLNVNSQCPASIPHVVYVTSDCLPGKRMEVTLDEKYELKMNLSHNDEENCNMTMCSGIKNISVSLSTTPISDISIYPNVTTDGYVNINATLLDGVPGMMIIIKYTNGSVYLSQPILRNSPNVSYACANNTKPLTNGNFYLDIYMLKDDRRSFNVSLPIQQNFSITCHMPRGNDSPGGKKKGFPLWATIVLVILMIIIFIIVILVAAKLGHNAGRRRNQRLNGQNRNQEMDQNQVILRHEDLVRDPGADGREPEVREQREQGGGANGEEAEQREQGGGANAEEAEQREQGGGANEEEAEEEARQMPTIETQSPGDSHKQNYPVLTQPATLYSVNFDYPSQSSTSETVNSESMLLKHSPTSAQHTSKKNPVATIIKDSVHYSSTGDCGSDVPLIKDYQAASSYRVTGAEEKSSTNEDKLVLGTEINKPEEAKGDGGPSECVYNKKDGKSNPNTSLLTFSIMGKPPSLNHPDPVNIDPPNDH